MKNDLEFELTFEGTNLDGGSIDARDLAPSLLALSEAIDLAREQVVVDSRPVALRVRPNFEKGSFRVFLEIGQSYYSHFIDLFSGNHVQAWATLFSLLGLSGAGLLQLIKTSKGKKPIRVVEIEETRRVKVVFENCEEEVPKEVFMIFSNPRIRKALEGFVRPLLRGSLERMNIRHRGVRTLEVNQEEASSFRSDGAKDKEVISEGERFLQLVAPSFKQGNKWRFNDGGRSDYYSVLDSAFVEGVRERRILFGSHEYFRCVVRSTQVIEEDGIKSHHEILRVIRKEVIPTQDRIDFDGKD